MKGRGQVTRGRLVKRMRPDDLSTSRVGKISGPTWQMTGTGRPGHQIAAVATMEPRPTGHPGARLATGSRAPAAEPPESLEAVE